VGISDVSASAIGYRLRKRLSTAIEKASRDEIYGYVVPAATQLFRLMKEAKSESVRLAASKDILDRAGFKPIERQEVTVTELNKMTVQELRAELERLMN
jgi:predicted SPOUT superfamily RNA methylase MTH1